MNGLRTLAWMTRKELLRFAADPAGAVLTFAVPVLLAVLMSAVFAPRDFVDPLPLLVSADHPGPRTLTLIERLDANAAVLVERVPAEVARRRVIDGEAAAALILPPEAEGALRPLSLFAGDEVPVEVLLDPSRSTEVDILEGLFTREVMGQLSGELGSPQGRTAMFRDVAVLTAASPLLSPEAKARWADFARAGIALDEGVGTAASAGAGLKAPLRLERKSLEVFNPKAAWNPHAHYFAGMLTMSLLFLGATASLNLVQERDEGALTRVRLSGASPLLALLGGALGTTIVALLAAIGVFLAGVLAFAVPVGSPVGLVAMLISLAAMVGGFSLFLAALGQTARQISILGPFVILVAGFLGGSAVPTFIMPGYIRSIGILLPTTWANEGLAAATWRGAETGEVLGWAAGVAGFAVVFALGGAYLFRWRP